MTKLHQYSLRVNQIIKSRLALLLVLVLILFLPMFAPKGKVLAGGRPSMPAPTIIRLQDGGMEPEDGSFKCNGQCPQQTLSCQNGTMTIHPNNCCITCENAGGSTTDCCRQ